MQQDALLRDYHVTCNITNTWNLNEDNNQKQAEGDMSITIIIHIYLISLLDTHKKFDTVAQICRIYIFICRFGLV